MTTTTTTTTAFTTLTLSARPDVDGHQTVTDAINRSLAVLRVMRLTVDWKISDVVVDSGAAGGPGSLVLHRTLQVVLRGDRSTAQHAVDVLLAAFPVWRGYSFDA